MFAGFVVEQIVVLEEEMRELHVDSVALRNDDCPSAVQVVGIIAGEVRRLDDS